MEHIYNNIDGWFNYQNFYDTLVTTLPENFVFVEVGVWKGKSISYFTVETIKQNKKGKIYAVDHWLGSEEHQKGGWAYDPATDTQEGLYAQYLSNIKPIQNHIINIRSSSVDASKIFLDNSIDAIFIDASHDHDSVYQDLSYWFPKVKENGVIAGHDYDWAEVRLAVDSFFLNKNQRVNTPINSVWESHNES
jgi:hypothetical protein